MLSCARWLFPLMLLPLLPVARADLEAGLSAATRQNWSVARTEFETAAHQGDAAAMVNLGNLYRKGLGVNQDDTEALKWYQRAADQGDRAGQGKLGLSYYFGLGVSIDYGMAAQWFQRAAEQGEPTAQAILAALYARGDGVERTPASAYFWYTRALEQGHPEAEQARAELVETMSPGEISDALGRLAAADEPARPQNLGRPADSVATVTAAARHHHARPKSRHKRPQARKPTARANLRSRRPPG